MYPPKTRLDFQPFDAKGHDEEQYLPGLKIFARMLDFVGTLVLLALQLGELALELGDLLLEHVSPNDGRVQSISICRPRVLLRARC